MSALSDVETAFPARMITIRTFSDLKGASTSAVFSLCLDSYTNLRETTAKRGDEFRTLGHGAAGPFDHQCVCSSAVGIDDCGPGSSIVSGIPFDDNKLEYTWTADNTQHQGPLRTTPRVRR
ncbi:hypothetical protein NCU17024 [Neurospora crassa OR74A]|uniref:Uncharacterized protein n=1 Tax=Neurospora crassa (strain ATCC 24698 / 74-OR23-1A / CBS 708.71 / DSM 1257 / FGSC 987) TaxID=367110 RepID=V5IND6_NEUCR|nr:hypothetical protein NCU17024 [Neurospora crassa OR74A]ESA42659.1 hypothetical protein NCU17024 [Neurospora crassa OR74A]|eukprot:XP_011394846.1 hypothetical protein NCU17024 [Neurospora crassa OR74A]